MLSCNALPIPRLLVRYATSSNGRTQSSASGRRRRGNLSWCDEGRKQYEKTKLGPCGVFFFWWGGQLLMMLLLFFDITNQLYNVSR